jgi:hypothetical protein
VKKIFILVFVFLTLLILTGCTPDGQLFLEEKQVVEDTLILTFEADLNESVDLKIELFPDDNSKSSITQEHSFSVGNYLEDVTLSNLQVNTKYTIKLTQITGKYLSNFGVIDKEIRVYPYASEISTELLNEYQGIVNTFYASNNFNYMYEFDLRFVENGTTYVHSETLDLDFYNGLRTYSTHTINNNSQVSTIFIYSEKNESGYDLYFNQNNQGWQYVFESENNLDNIENQVYLDLRQVIGIEKTIDGNTSIFDVVLSFQGYQELYSNMKDFFGGGASALEGNETLTVHIEVANGNIVSIEFDVSMLIEPFLDKNFDLSLSYCNYSIAFSKYGQINPIIIPKEVK